MGHLADGNAATQESIASAGGIGAATRAMEAFPADGIVQDHCCFALGALAENSAENSKAIQRLAAAAVEGHEWIYVQRCQLLLHQLATSRDDL